MNPKDISPFGPASASDEYLTFRLADEEYAIDIMTVREIREFEQPTRIAGAPGYMLGVANLRGVIVPVIDLRLKFGCERADYGDFTVVIILALGERTVGAVVDSVSDVVRIEPQQVQDAPDMDGLIDASCITGLAPLDERMLILLDIERLMRGADLGMGD